MIFENPFVVLGVPPDLLEANRQSAKRLRDIAREFYRTIAKVDHPDRGGSGDVVADATEAIKMIDDVPDDEVVSLAGDVLDVVEHDDGMAERQRLARAISDRSDSLKALADCIMAPTFSGRLLLSPEEMQGDTYSNDTLNLHRAPMPLLDIQVEDGIVVAAVEVAPPVKPYVNVTISHLERRSNGTWIGENIRGDLVEKRLDDPEAVFKPVKRQEELLGSRILGVIPGIDPQIFHAKSAAARPALPSIRADRLFFQLFWIDIGRFERASDLKPFSGRAKVQSSTEAGEKLVLLMEGRVVVVGEIFVAI